MGPKSFRQKGRLSPLQPGSEEISDSSSEIGTQDMAAAVQNQLCGVSSAQPS